MATTTVIVESRHLDTDARARDRFEVPPPATASEERSRLIDLVRDLHPAASHRSYAEGAATFLDRDHLIVAYYERREAPGANGRTGPSRSGRTAQDRLFEA